MAALCKKNISCTNVDVDKIVIIDTCVIMNIMSSIIYNLKMKGFYGGDKFKRFMTFLNHILTILNYCPYGERIITTNFMYQGEINIFNTESTMRNFDELIDVCGGDVSNMELVGNLLNDKIVYRKDGITMNKIKELRKYVRKTAKLYKFPSNNDFSLILLGLIRTQDRKGIILTDDDILSEALDAVTDNRNINLGSNVFDTTNLIRMSSLTYLTNSYRCCKLYQQEFSSLIEYLKNYVHDLKERTSYSLVLKEKDIERAYERVYDPEKE